MPVQVVLVRPESPANVGAVARVVRNTGLDGLRLVAPGDWRTVECWRTAWGSHEVLEQARVFDDLPSAVADAQMALAFSGKRETGAAWLDVREAAAAIARRAEETACLVFGPENSGLTQDELAACGHRVLIPAHHEQPSLNLSHAVMVAAYEVFRARTPPAPGPRRATLEEKAAMLERLRDGLIAIGALPETNTDDYLQEWRALFARADLTPQEVRLLEHLGRKMVKPRGSPREGD
ncbi:MAG TPA: TrmH family RNA methyltransferase [Vicinamibacteria bacterium]|nr:TrmH family RNA methyltransferase [Vicinamibacteria bacterium]